MTDNDEKFEISIYFVDTTYGADDDQWAAKSAALKNDIEAEYKIVLRDDDIGPGWSFPVFATTIIEYWPVAGLTALFFAGEKIEKNMDAWGRLYDRLKHFLSRRVYLDRNGASVLAMNAVITKCGSLPSSLILTGYSVWSAIEGDPPRDLTPIAGLDGPPARKFLSTTVHIFQITADNKSHKVFVSGPDVQLIDMPTTEAPPKVI